MDILLDFVTALPNMLAAFTKGIDTKQLGGGLIKYLLRGTFVCIMLSESAVCHYNGTVHSAQLRGTQMCKE